MQTGVNSVTAMFVFKAKLKILLNCNRAQWSDAISGEMDSIFFFNFLQNLKNQKARFYVFKVLSILLRLHLISHFNHNFPASHGAHIRLLLLGMWAWSLGHVGQLVRDPHLLPTDCRPILHH